MKKVKFWAIAGVMALLLVISSAGTVAAVADEAEELLVDGLAWNADVTTKSTEPLKFDDIVAKEVIIEGGNTGLVRINGGNIDKVTVKKPEVEKFGFKEIGELLAAGFPVNEVIEMYQNNQKAKADATALKPTVKVVGGAEIDELVVSGSAILNLAGGNVEEVTIKAAADTGRMLVTIQNYDGKVNVEQTPNTDGTNNIVNVELENSNLAEINVAGEDKCVFHVGGDAKSEVAALNVAGASSVTTLVDTEKVQVAKSAENSTVRIYADAKDVVIEADNSKFFVASNAVVDNAKIEGENVKLSYAGIVHNSEVVGKDSEAVYEEEPTPSPLPTATPSPTPSPKPSGTVIGSENNTTGWWTAHSETFKVEEGESEKLTFYNFTGGVENWHNFVVVLQNVADAHGTADNATYTEYAAVRADNYGWGTGYSSAQLSSNWNWDTFKTDMNGAKVDLIVSNHGTTADVKASITTTTGKSYYQNYIGLTITGDLYFCLTTENGHLIIPGTEKPVDPETPVEPTPEATPTPEPTPEITLAPIPEKLVATGEVLGATDKSTAWWTVFSGTTKVEAGTAARVYFKNYGGASNWNNFVVILQNVADGAEGYAEYAVTRADNWGWGAGYDGIATQESNWNWDTFVAEMSEATVVLDIVNYGKTADVIATITTSTGETRYQKYLGIAVDGDLYYRLTVDGAYIEYLEPAPEATPEPTPVILGSEDCSTAWWTVFTDAVKVEEGKTETVTFKNYTSGIENWHNFAVILKDAANAEYAVVRPDHYGWGAGYGTATLESNWNWETFKTDMNGATVELSITNNGGTADVVANITTATGDTHFQKFLGITITGDLYYSLTMECAYLVFE